MLLFADRSVLFDQDGIRLFAGAHNVLKIFSRPSTSAYLDSVSVNWGDVADMALSQNYLVRISSLSCSVQATWFLELKPDVMYMGILG